MVDVDQLYKPDYIHNIQYSAREYPVPRFSKPQEVRGGITRPVKSIVFSRDGKKVATGCDMRGLRVWDAREKMDAATSFSLPSGGEKSSPHGGHVASLAWSPVDPNILLSGCKNSLTGTYVAVWDIRTPKAPLSTHKLPSDILHISFHPSGTHFAVVCPRPQRDEVYFFHRIMGDEGEKWVKREDVSIGGAGADLGAEEINSLRFSNSGQFLCAVGNDGSLNAWSYPLQPRLPKPDSDKSAIDGVGMSGMDEVEPGPSRPSSPSGAGRRGGTPEAQETTEGDVVVESEDAEKGEFPGEDVDMTEEIAVGASANGTPASKEKRMNGNTSINISTTSSIDLSTATVPPPTPSRAPSPPSQPSRPSRPTQESQDRQLKRIKHSIVHSASLLALGLDPTGKYLAVGGQDALVSVFSTRDWICTRTFDVSTGAIRHIAFSPDGEMIAFGGDDQAIYVVSVHSGQTLAKLPVPATVNALSWHPQKNWLAYSVVSKGAIVWYMVQQE